MDEEIENEGGLRGGSGRRVVGWADIKQISVLLFMGYCSSSTISLLM